VSAVSSHRWTAFANQIEHAIQFPDGIVGQTLTRASVVDIIPRNDNPRPRRRVIETELDFVFIRAVLPATKSSRRLNFSEPLSMLFDKLVTIAEISLRRDYARSFQIERYMTDRSSGVEPP